MTRSKFTVRMKGDIPGAARKAADLAARAVFTELFAEMQDAMGKPVWYWPRDTVRLGKRKRKGRRKGEMTGGYIAGNPRNIKDTGLLQQSGVAFFPTARSAKFVWSIPYASHVHNGAWVFPWGDRDRRVYTPARPWTLAVTGQVKVPGITPYDFQEKASLYWRKFFKP